MKNRILFAMIPPIFLALTGAATAGCYADYKAKQAPPLQLHYGVIQLSDAACSNPELISAETQTRIAVEGWQLLNILSVFGDDGLENRKANAGEFFLRF